MVDMSKLTYELLVQVILTANDKHGLNIDPAKIDYEGLKQNSDQIWAEAIYQYKNGGDAGVFNEFLSEEFKK